MPTEATNSLFDDQRVIQMYVKDCQDANDTYQFLRILHLTQPEGFAADCLFNALVCVKQRLDKLYISAKNSGNLLFCAPLPDNAKRSEVAFPLLPGQGGRTQ